ncbi:hypothetical protein M5E87_03005 [Flavonifractor plautii]|uniref:hypothetical protein n=1 Tax=Flavonifractor plautii TaxID=292800 RepID=UPI001FA7F535|nr:hypothetical protein [Flavonifractor plautii]UQT49025.1 hypothetical protein M5E87_03005 [Flavonifractor plautii]
MAGADAGHYLAAGGLHGPPGRLRPQTAEETEVLAALLAGARVRVERDALEYRRYRRTAPLGIYQKCAGLERRLREMGICVAGTGGR